MLKIVRDICGKDVEIPFMESGAIIDFPYVPLRDLVFVFPLPMKKGIIEIPQRYLSLGDYGVVLAAGRGYYNKKGSFIVPGLAPGQVVVYDKNVPWEVLVTDKNGIRFLLKLMGSLDVRALVSNSDGGVVFG